MPVTVNPIRFYDALLCAFNTAPTFAGSSIFTNAVLFGGVQPPSPASSVGAIQLTSPIALSGNDWMSPAGGVTALANPRQMTGIADDTAVFLRLYYSTDPLIDIPVSTSPARGVAVLSTVNVSTGWTLDLLDLRLKIATVGDASISPSIANYLLMMLTGQPNPFVDITNSAEVPYLGAFSSFYRDPSNNELDDLTTEIIAYSGPIPVSASAPLAGNTILWQKSLSSYGNQFDVVGGSVSLLGSLVSTAISSGTPSFIRIIRPSVDHSGEVGSALHDVVTPICVTQIPVGGPASACSFVPAVLTSGQPASLVQCTLNVIV